MKELHTKYSKFNISSNTMNNLKGSFLECMKDEDFVKVVDSIDLPKEELIKYTSKITKCSKEIKNCSNCDGLLSCKNEVVGFTYTPKINAGFLDFTYDACKYKRKNMSEEIANKNTYVFDVPHLIKNARIKDIHTDDKNRYPAIKWVTKYISDYKKGVIGKGLYLSGNFGCGKSYILASLINELASLGSSVAIVYLPEYLRSLKASFSTDFNEKYEVLSEVDFLLIDDIGAENVTPWGRDEIIGALLQYRMEENLPTFFTSNLTIEELEVHYSVTSNKIDKIKSRRIIERIKNLTTEMSMISANKRN